MALDDYIEPTKCVLEICQFYVPQAEPDKSNCREKKEKKGLSLVHVQKKTNYKAKCEECHKYNLNFFLSMDSYKYSY